MKRIPRGRMVSGIILVFVLLVAGCGDDDGRSVGPGLVEFENQPTVNLSDPLLEVRYTRPGFPATVTATILNDPSTSGDIAFDPVLNTFSIAMGQTFLLFGIDHLAANDPEYRAFLDFPLDGSAGGAVIPSDAIVSFAMLRIFVTAVESFATVPVLVDLVEYPLSGLEAFDFTSPPLAFRSPLDIFVEDVGQFVDIEVTTLMQEAQFLGLLDFQVRLLVQ